MFRCITTAGYTHKCDILEKYSEWDYDSGTSIDTWVVAQESVPCHVTSFVNGGIKGNGTIEKWDEGMHISEDYLRLKTKKSLTKSQRVTNIRAVDGEVVWKEEEFDDAPTLFNVDGSAPIADPFSGKALEFVSILSRAEIQSG